MFRAVISQVWRLFGHVGSLDLARFFRRVVYSIVCLDIIKSYKLWCFFPSRQHYNTFLDGAFKMYTTLLTSC